MAVTMHIKDTHEVTLEEILSMLPSSSKVARQVVSGIEKLRAELEAATIQVGQLKQGMWQSKDAEIASWKESVYQHNARVANLEEYRDTLKEVLQPFANYACDPPCGCHNCKAREALAESV